MSNKTKIGILLLIIGVAFCILGVVFKLTIGFVSVPIAFGAGIIFVIAALIKLLSGRRK